EIVKNVPDRHVVDGEQKFTLLRFPDGDCPIADDAAETIGVPSVEGGSENSDIGWAVVKIATQVGNKHFAVVEASVPSDDEASARGERLFLLARFSRGMKRTIEQHNRVAHIARLSVWALLPQGLTKVLQQFPVDRPPVEVPYAALHTHDDLL